MVTDGVKLRSPLGPQTDDDRRCFDRGMEQWRASLKRPDMTEEDRVKGALDAYCRQAFALAPSPLPSRRGEAVPVGWMLVPREPTEAMKREGVTKALSVSLGAGYTWPDYMADLWSTMLYASPQPEAYGVRVTDEMVEAAARAWCRAWDIDPDFPYSMVAGAAPWWKVEAKAMRAALEAALSHTEQGEPTP